MYALKIVATGAIAVVAFLGASSSRVPDGGNVETYWKPIMLIWYIFTVVAFIPKFDNPAFNFIRKAWWLQDCSSIVFLLLGNQFGLSL